MLVVTPWCPREQEQLINVLRWEAELGGAKGHELLLVAAATCNEAQRNEAYDYATKVYDKVEVIRAYYESVKPWPINPNLMFQRAFWHIFQTSKVPFFLNEPDLIPLKPRWLDLFAAEYKVCGKPLMGCVVTNPHHLTGNAIYSMEYMNFAADALLTENVPWDVTCVNQVLPHVHHTQQYYHIWSKGSPHTDPNSYDGFGTHFDTQEELNVIPAEAAVLHRNKDGSVIKLLRERLHGPKIEIVTEAPIAVLEAAQAPVTKCTLTPDPVKDKVGILYRSYGRDHEFLKYSLRSVAKFARGFHRLVVVVPQCDAVVMSS
jgi:hypothetical protein